MLKDFTSCCSSRARGFSLIELMVAIVIGSLVIAGAGTLIVSTIQANATTVQSARLTQELRTTLEVIAADIRRARRVDDPLGQIGVTAADQAKTPAVAYHVATDTISSPSAGCLKYGYQAGLDEALNATDPQPAKYYHAIYLNTSSVPGTVVLVTGDTSANVTCSATPTVTLSSSLVDITDLRFEPATPPPASPGVATTVDNDAIKITISGRPQFRSGKNLSVTRTLTQIINVRSGKSGT